MQLLGIGFAKKSWDSLTKRLQKQFSHQLNSDLFVDPRLNSAMKNESEEIQNILVKISNLKPDWIILYSKYFENPALYIKLIDNLRNISHKNIYFVMAIENIKQNINSFVKFLPEFELVNKMNLTLSTAELIIEQRIKTFPRIRLNSEFNKMKYKNNFGDLVNYSADEIPKNSLIPLASIDGFETDMGELEPNKWIEGILKKKDLDIKNHKVLAILSEKKGCYLFPGIPFDSILNVKINNIKIDHLINIYECKKNNPLFKRLIKNMELEYQNGLNENKYFFRGKKLKKFFYIKKLLVKDLLENLFYEMFQLNVKIIKEMDHEIETFKDPIHYLKLDDSPSQEMFESTIDWSIDYKKIFSVLKNFVNLNELDIPKNLKYLPIHKIEFEKFKNKLSNEEIEIKKIIGHSETYEKIFAQELDIFKKLDSLTNLLKEVLIFSMDWEKAYKMASEITKNKLVLICEEESRAAELNYKLKEVKKKLWINPFIFNKSEDLIHLNTKTIRNFLKPEGIVIDNESKVHLENLCRECKKEFKKIEKDFNENNLKIKHLKTDLSLIQKNKRVLALRWLDNSFRQLLYRDRHLFKSI